MPHPYYRTIDGAIAKAATSQRDAAKHYKRTGNEFSGITAAYWRSEGGILRDYRTNPALALAPDAMRTLAVAFGERASDVQAQAQDALDTAADRLERDLKPCKRCRFGPKGSLFERCDVCHARHVRMSGAL